MTRTIIKTGCVLLLPTGTFDKYDQHKPPHAEYEDGRCVVHGDLHLIPGACILYLPNDQAPIWPRFHGTLDLRGKFFYRKTEPYSAFVTSIQHVALLHGALHEIDEREFRVNGGRIILNVA